MIVRRARLEDAAAIAEVHVRTWQAAYQHVFGAERLAALDLDARTRRWEAWLTAGENTSVAVAAGRVVAFVWVGPSREAPDEGELLAIYALPDAWGSSAGRELMAAGLAALREHGFAEAILWVLADNPRARRFYEREGWHTDGGLKREAFLDVEVEEVRYRISL